MTPTKRYGVAMTPARRRILDLAVLAATDDDALAVLQDALLEDKVIDLRACVRESDVEQPDWSGLFGAPLLIAKRRFVAACIADTLGHVAR